MKHSFQAITRATQPRQDFILRTITRTPFPHQGSRSRLAGFNCGASQSKRIGYMNGTFGEHKENCPLGENMSGSYPVDFGKPFPLREERDRDWLLMHTDGFKKSLEHHTVYARDTDRAAKGIVSFFFIFGKQEGATGAQGPACSEFFMDVPCVIHQLAASKVFAVF